MDVNDTIPLHEIDEVVEMDDECETTHKHHSLGSKSNSLSKDNALQRSVISEFVMPGMFEIHQKSSDLAANSQATENESVFRSYLAQSRFSNILQIKTAAAGVNSGRTYYSQRAAAPTPRSAGSRWSSSCPRTQGSRGARRRPSRASSAVRTMSRRCKAPGCSSSVWRHSSWR